VVFRSAYLTSTVNQLGSFQPATNYSQISFTIQNVNNEYLLIGPSSWNDQSAIEKLKEGYYFLYVTGNQFGGNFFQLQWMFSLFNSDNDPDPSQT
jgi:hypothetical protein